MPADFGEYHIRLAGVGSHRDLALHTGHVPGRTQTVVVTYIGDAQGQTQGSAATCACCPRRVLPAACASGLARPSFPALIALPSQTSPTHRPSLEEESWGGGGGLTGVPPFGCGPQPEGPDDNSIAFGKADSQPISQAARQAVSRAVSWASRQADWQAETHSLAFFSGGLQLETRGNLNLQEQPVVTW